MYATLLDRFLAAGPAGIFPHEWGSEAFWTPPLTDVDEPWRFGLPHEEQNFSRRHLRVQVSQRTDQGARRVCEQVALLDWLRKSGVALDDRHVVQPLSGPGMTARALCEVASVGSYVGIDLSPAACAYAKARFRWRARFAFVQGDVATWHPARDRPLDLILLLYEAANALPREALWTMLPRLCGGLRSGGYVVLELRDGPDAVPPPLRRVRCHERDGLFSPEPHIVLEERGTFGRPRHVGHQYLVHTIRTGRIEAVHRSVLRLYAVEEIVPLLQDCHLEIAFMGHPFHDRPSDVQEARGNIVIVARR